MKTMQLIAFLILLATATLTYEALRPQPKPVNPAFKDAGLPLALKEKLCDQIKMDNGVLVEVLQTLAAELQCNAGPDPDQVESLERQVNDVLNDSYAVLEEAK